MIARIATVPWRLLVVVVLAATGSVYAWLGLSNPHVGLLADDALYLLMAELYSPYRDAVGAVSEHVRRYSHLPPGLVALAGRAATPLPDASYATFRTTRYWLDATRGGDPLAQIAGLAAHERASDSIDELVAPDACVYAPVVQLVLLRGQRPAFLPPPPARMAQGPPYDCDYFLLTNEARAGRPAFYPLDYLRHGGTALALERRDAANPRSRPVAILMRASRVAAD